eukprot:8450499-Alexandrium_andersonii.AAC.1
MTPMKYCLRVAQTTWRYSWPATGGTYRLLLCCFWCLTFAWGCNNPSTCVLAPYCSCDPRNLDSWIKELVSPPGQCLVRGWA